MRGSIFRVNTRTLLHSTRQRKSNSTWFRGGGPLSFGCADFVESANSSFRILQKFRRTFRDSTRWYQPPTNISRAQLSFRRDVIPSCFRSNPSIAESKIIHFSIHGDFTLVRWIFHLNNGGWIGRDEFFKRGFRICEFSNCDGNGEANNNVSSKGNVFVLFGAQSIGVE